MPFKSKAQQRFLFSQHPDVAEKFAKETPKDAYKNLPEHKEVNKSHPGMFHQLRKMMGGK